MADIRDEFLTRGELAAELGISERTFVRWEKSGQAPARTVLGKRILYKKETVNQWLSSREQQIRDPAPVAKPSAKEPDRGGRRPPKAKRGRQ